MKEVQPQIYIVGETVPDRGVLNEYLLNVGIIHWQLPYGIGGMPLLVEFMGRLCYQSFGVELNPNITRVRSDSAAYIANLIESEHGSVFEHASINFIFRNVSRVFTHELVRHRVGTAISQESQRYVRLEEIPVWIPALKLPSSVEQELRADLEEIIQRMEAHQAKWSRRLNLDTSKDFDYKKRWTSTLRRFFTPSGVATSIGWTCNVRELRHVIKMRTSPGAEEEMQLVFGQVRVLMQERWPLLFGDL